MSETKLVRVMLGVTLALLLGSNAYLYWRFHRLELSLAEWRISAAAEISDVRDHVVSNNSTTYRGLELLREELTQAREQATKSAGRARLEAQRHAERLARQLSEEQQKQQKQQEQVASELVEVKATTTNVTSAVQATKLDLANTQSEVANTGAELKRMKGDLGVMSGMIATNSSELASLKAIGDRNYIEFRAHKGKQPQHVGDIAMLVKKTDPKRSKYSIELWADDRKIEKHDRTANEPVQFYVSRARQPYEIVVNQVNKDELVGYLATPKVQMARK
jgi:chromosome segregation ATPase